MATIAPWLKPSDVTEAYRSGGSLGSAVAQVRERAREANLSHQEALARISAQNASTAAQAAIRREQLMAEAASRREATQAASQSRAAALAEQARQFDVEQLSQGRETPESPWSGPITLKDGRVVQIDRNTGQMRQAVGANMAPIQPQMTPTQEDRWYRTNPAMVAEEDAFLRDKATGMTGEQLQQRHPIMFSQEPFRSKYKALLGAASSGATPGQLSLDDLMQSGLEVVGQGGTNLPAGQGAPSPAATNQDVIYKIVDGVLRRQ